MMRIIKVGGRPQQDRALPRALAGAWRSAPGALCVVHGGGDEVSTLQRAFGREPAFQGGRRITTADDIDLLRMALSGSANKRLVAALASEGVEAIGISGEDGALIEADLDRSGALGLVGTPVRINAALVQHLLNGGYMPVISPLARQLAPAGTDTSLERTVVGSAAAAAGDRAVLNVNGDDAAAAIAVALGAGELLLVSDVEGVRVNGIPVAELTSLEAQDLIATGQASEGMAAKIEAALRAVSRGIPNVRIGDLAAIGDPGRGTIIAHARSFA